MDTNSALHTLRHGFKCYGRTLRIAYFKAAHDLNPDLEARYAANILGVTRQLRYNNPGNSQQKRGVLDVTLSLNGIPVATLELKNPLTGQNVEDASASTAPTAIRASSSSSSSAAHWCISPWIPKKRG